ncbi:MAG: hypothetical protein KGL63_14855 [Betaproteobacteria bacterium]|nr:hypothetical protein [Betaproteobacteria bacterium]
MSDLLIFRAVLVLLALDVLTTCFTLWRIHGGQEANTVMRWLMDRLGVFPALVLSHGIPAGMFWLVYKAGAIWPYGEIVGAVYAVVVLSNVVGILTGRTLIQRLMGR